ncbi:MAG: oligosaccharide flippase family protein [Alteraurantiacibacter sp.]
MVEKTAFSGLRSILRNGLLLTGVNWAEALLRAAYVLIIARVLGPADYGVWSYVLATYMVAVMATALGMEVIITGRLGRDRENSSPLLETTLALRLSLLGIAAISLAAFALGNGEQPQIAFGLGLSLLAVFGRGLVMWARPVFVGMERSDIALRTTLVCRLGEVALGLVLLFITQSILFLIALHSLSWMVEGILAFLRARNLTGVSCPRYHRGEARPLIRQGLPIGIAMLGVAVLSAAPVLLARQQGAGLAQVAQLGIVIQFATLAVMVGQGFLGAAQPVLSRAIAREDKRLPRYGALVAVISATGFGILALIATYLGEFLIVGLLGPLYLTAAELLPWAFVIGGLSLLPTGFWQEQALRQHTRPGVFAAIASVACTIILVPPLYEARGLEGVLLAVAGGWTLRAAVLIGAVFQKPT